MNRPSKRFVAVALLVSCLGCSRPGPDHIDEPPAQADRGSLFDSDKLVIGFDQGGSAVPVGFVALDEKWKTHVLMSGHAGAATGEGKWAPTVSLSDRSLYFVDRARGCICRRDASGKEEQLLAVGRSAYDISWLVLSPEGERLYFMTGKTLWSVPLSNPGKTKKLSLGFSTSWRPVCTSETKLLLYDGIGVKGEWGSIMEVDTEKVRENVLLTIGEHEMGVRWSPDRTRFVTKTDREIRLYAYPGGRRVGTLAPPFGECAIGTVALYDKDTVLVSMRHAPDGLDKVYKVDAIAKTWDCVYEGSMSGMHVVRSK